MSTRTCRIPASLKPSKGLKLPIVAAPMFLASNPKVVTACCKNGIIGTFPALNQRTSEGYEEWLQEIKKINSENDKKQPGTVAPFGVNLIVHRSNPRLEADLKITVKHKVPLVITSLGAVQSLVDSVHSYGGVVFHDVINVRHAKKAASAGVDGLILVTAGAGGHAGLINAFALVSEVRSFFKGTILLAGAVSKGSDVAAARAMGADLAYVGTRFLATHEASVDSKYKEMIVESGSSDVTYTKEISGVHANFLTKSIVNAGLDPTKLKATNKEIDFGKELSEAKAWKDIWSAGNGVGAIQDIISVDELIERMSKEYVEAVDFVSKNKFRANL